MGESNVSYAPTEDQELIRSTARQFIEERVSLAKVREVMMTDDGFDRALWGELAEMGWSGLIVAEQHGGSGLGPVELCVLSEEMGRGVVGGPFLGTAVFAAAILNSIDGSDDTGEVLKAISSGEVVSPAVYERDWTTDTSSTSAEREGDRWVLTGEKRSVLFGHVADKLLVTAAAPDGLGLFVVDSEATGLDVTQERVLDLTRRQARVTLTGVEASARLDHGDARSAVERASLLTSIALASEQVGGAQACLEMSVDYAKSRYQFGRPIGSYQSIKHRCANMLVKVEQARSAAMYANRVTEDHDEFPIAGHMAASLASEGFVWVAGENIQVHGGIGFTWEHDAHLFLKRAKASSLLFGSPRHHRDLMGSALGI